MKNIKNAEYLANGFLKRLDSLIAFNSVNSSGEILSVYDSWEKIIGNEKLAGNSELYDIKNNTAVIKVNHSGWSQQILMYKNKIIKNFTRFYPSLKIKNISIIVEN